MQDKLIVALDKPGLKEACALIELLEDRISIYKVGLELFLNSKGAIIEYLKKQDKKIFLDLKFHDIPNTVAQAAKWATSLGVDIFDIHAAGGRDMLLKTMEVVNDTAAQTGIARPKVVAITVLTSFNEASFSQMGFEKNIGEIVLDWGKMCKESGLDGVVCSPHEVGAIKNACGRDFLTICPGVRPLWAEKQDQKRITTPKDAVLNGVDYIVIGRPITQNPSPPTAAEKILKEMEETV